ncbi:hypothetical protein [Polymorphobacter megasporae]|uniref:hypothetical protein n=1 Tax=Glacieibacterium megasporae TaxID=2835787 RepID=UPI001C1E35C8|nr:hypothetical protein [Polymorphobacter megasporae]UAJ12697.1 hypothetical protein KTC28_19300 [Polymorphobacter megasporae]
MSPAPRGPGTDMANPHTPMYNRGVGEIGITGGSAAIADRGYIATVERIHELPVTLARLL